MASIDDPINMITSNSSIIQNGTPVLPLIETKNQPTDNFIFPKTNKRSFCSKWFKIYTWLHYDQSKDRAFCFDCISFFHKTNHKLDKNIELSFLIYGYNNWKKAHEKFRSHENSKMHINSVHFILNRNTKTSVISLLTKQKLEDQKNASIALLTIISTLRYLSKMGLSIRGHLHNEGNFIHY